MELTYTPDVCQETVDKKTGKKVPPRFTGTVTIRLPTYAERDGVYAAAGIYSESEVEADEAETEKRNKERGRKIQRAFAARARDFVVKIDLTRVADGARVTRYEDLEFNSGAGFLVITDIGLRLAGGNELGNGSQQSSGSESAAP